MTDKKSKSAKQMPLDTLIKGLARLVRGQRCFSEEFGLRIEKVFPNLSEALNVDDLEALLLQWLHSDADGEKKIKCLFDALVQHQVILIKALDGVAMKALETLELDQTPLINTIARLYQRLKSLQPQGQLHDFKQNHQRRFYELVVPGLLAVYTELLQDNDIILTANKKVSH